MSKRFTNKYKLEQFENVYDRMELLERIMTWEMCGVPERVTVLTLKNIKSPYYPDEVKYDVKIYVGATETILLSRYDKTATTKKYVNVYPFAKFLDTYGKVGEGDYYYIAMAVQNALHNHYFPRKEIVNATENNG